MPTLCGLRRRGYTPSSIFEFVKKAGVSKVYSLVDYRLLEHCLRTELELSAPRPVSYTHLDVYKRQAHVPLHVKYDQLGHLSLVPLTARGGRKRPPRSKVIFYR